MSDDFHLKRFTDAQDASDTFGSAVEELKSAAKRSHWMWFVFPQISGLGHSAMARHYAISDLEEARAYLAHPVLGARLKMCAGVLAQLRLHDPVQIFGLIDSLKLRSSMTLFMRADPASTIFQQVLDQYFGGEPDAETDRRLLPH